MTLNYQGKTYVTYAGAHKRFEAWAAQLPRSVFFVAAQPAETGTVYFPVCAISADDAHRAFEIASRGIYVVRP